MGPKLSLGNYTANPYSLEGLNLKVYCVEELCYALKENAFLLDLDCMSDRLVKWIAQECGLSELARKLHELIHRKGSLSVFVCSILEYTGFYDAATIQSVAQTLKKGAGLDRLNKRKMRIDYLVEQKKYRAAVEEYNALLTVWEDAHKRGDTIHDSLKAALLHNKGTALTGLMLYKEAAEAFWQAYETDAAPESLSCHLGAKRLELSEKEYVDYIAGLPQYHPFFLELERDVEKINTAWEQEGACIRLLSRRDLLDQDESSYLEDSDHMITALKDGYRSMI